MRIDKQRIPRVLSACALVAALMLAPGAARAGGVVGNGTPDSCTESAFDAALGGGGSVTFSCGAEPYTLVTNSQKSISLNTVIDGGGKIILDGLDGHRLFDVSASLTLRNIVLTRGRSNGDGGAISSTGTLILENSTIVSSRAMASGGAIVSYGPLTIINSSLRNNTALNGGAVYPRFAAAQTTIINSALSFNHATDTTNGWGGAILAWDGAPVTIDGGAISNNSARQGGGIYHFGNSVLTVRNSTLLQSNQAEAAGGGIYNYSGTAMLANVTLSENRSGYGAGFFNLGAAVLANTSLSDNLGAYGGGLYNFGTATLTNDTINGNDVTIEGGGIHNFSGTALLTNVTISDNTADSGGGLYNFGAATLTNVTVSDNWADTNGGGIFGNGGSLIVKNSIVANSPSGGNCIGSVTNGGFNLSSDTSCGFDTQSNLVLGPLAENGGLTKTHMPLPGSPAIDYVLTGCPPPVTDQRGASRNVGACDAGAVEFGAFLGAYLPLVLQLGEPEL